MGLENIVFSLLLWVIITAFLFWWATPFFQPVSPVTPPSPQATSDPTELQELRQEIVRLRGQLVDSKAQAEGDLKAETFDTLQTLLVNYPSARKMADSRPEMPARNLSALFVPLENLLADWGYEPIAEVWEQVAYDPQLHQADEEDIAEGETVFVRFIGYRDGDTILAPAKVSRTLPPGV
jgi:hypothetical protein